MKKSLILVFLIVLIVFSSCIRGGNDPRVIDGPEVDNTGDGLSVDFRLDTKRIDQRRLDYTIKFENTGREPVTIEPSKFKLSSLQQDNQARGVFTSDSEADFYEQVFRNSNLILFQSTSGTDASLEMGGALFIEEWYFENTALTSFDWKLEVEYPYRTEFANGVEIRLDEPSNILKLKSKLEQAAPVKVTDIEVLSLNADEYRIEFTIRDSGRSGDSENRILLDNVEMRFGTQELGDCFYFVTEGGIKKRLEGEDISLTKDRSELVYTCDVNLIDFDPNVPTSTTVSGSFEYDYKILLTGKINLPKERDVEEIYR